ncbi:MAG TPA: hypothetical protein VK501_25855 [Baekduia sp.]|uniref:hypothetical protein n=1 Tax=Baekduia sp. TaxID=2600305 RepID=UPI002BD6722D|nr:hypothetical protein [Baekduia sp.]HMJ37356.1 hypothetical protein [Baekduia sp.]
MLVACALGSALAVAPPSVAAPPTITYTLGGAAGDAGWFRGPVDLTWILSGTITRSDGCNPTKLPDDTPGVQLTCSAANVDETTSVTTKAIKIDQTPPTSVTAVPARPPNTPPWYTAPLPISWSGADATSGIAACTTLTYAGPDGPSAAPAGTCRDVAGNTSAAVPLTFAYDATAPALSDLGVTLAARVATLRWTPGADATQVTVVRRPGDGGEPARTVADGAPGATRELADGLLAAGTAYTWTVSVRDVAGNASSATATATVPTAAQALATTTAANAKANAARRALRWRARRGAKYYNLQLFRNGRKILSAWPTKPHYTLKTTWRYRGRRHRLAAGLYRWYVWPGYGTRAQHRYGKLLTRGQVRLR